MAANALKKITTRAKQIRKKQPGKSWKSAVKEAGREYRAGKKAPARKKRKASVGAVKRSPAKRKGRVGTKPRYKVVHEVRQISGVRYTGGKISIAGTGKVEEQRKRLAHLIGDQIGWLEVAISTAKTEREKKALRGKKARLTAQLRRINNHG